MNNNKLSSHRCDSYQSGNSRVLRISVLGTKTKTKYIFLITNHNTTVPKGVGVAGCWMREEREGEVVTEEYRVAQNASGLIGQGRELEHYVGSSGKPLEWVSDLKTLGSLTRRVTKYDLCFKMIIFSTL